MSIEDINQIIYDTLHLDLTEVKEIIGCGDIKSIKTRREKISKFLEGNEWNLENYKKFLRANMFDPSTGKTTPVPSFAEMGVNMVKAVGDVVRKGPERCSEGERNLRYQLCLECEYIFDFHGYERCMKCGCFVKAKTYMKAWHCPIKKW